LKINRFLKPAALSLLAAGVLAFTACSAKEESAATTAAAEETAASTTAATVKSGTETTSAARTDENIIYGKVTAISGTKITVAVGTVNQRGEKPQNMPSGSGDSGEQTTGSAAESGSMPQGTPPGGNNSSGGAQGTPPSGGMGDLLTLTGESKTITVSDSVTITKQSMRGNFGGNPYSQNNTTDATSSKSDNSAAITDISVGSILKITYKTGTGTVASIEIIETQPSGMQPSSGKTGTDKTTSAA